MTSGVDELEAFIAALRLSFFTSSTVVGSPDGLRQGIAAFRETLRPRGPLSPEAYARKEDNTYNSGSDIFAQAEPISSTSTVYSGDDRIDAASLLTKRIDLVSTEVREGTSQIRELIQSVKELQSEVRDLRTALATSARVEGSEAGTQIIKTVKDRTSLAPIDETGVDGSPEQRDGMAATPPTVSSAAYPRSTTEVGSGGSVPSLLASVSSPAPSEASLRPPSLLTDLSEEESSDAKTIEHTTSNSNREGNVGIEDVNDLENSASTGSPPTQARPTVTATAVDHYNVCEDEELSIARGDKIAILDSPTPPSVGCMENGSKLAEVSS
ncbi:hypothetical protein FS837_003125 [Tulasnella sp. UAMH 9824]|nr:hypothetical protein FS837_003125 [Tulasnella sp. UAMH 9824]